MSVSFKRVAGLVVGIGALGLLLGGVATATIPMSTTGQYVACYRTSTGAMRMIDVQKGQNCYRGEKKIAWGPTYLWKGTYNPAAAYNPGAVVLLNGSSYVARLAVPKGQVPAGTGTTYWGLLAAKGDTGAPGTTMLLGPNKLMAEVWVGGTGLLAYSRSTNGASIQSSKFGTGQYLVRFPGFQTASSYQQAVQITSVTGAAVFCHNLGLNQNLTLGYVDVYVGCFNTVGAGADSGFMLQITS
jgi:hypothetical protein